ncbi:MAG TPA: hydrogenase maturation nickel metallochaperone HypA [Pirellulales bacterium]|nr:hydrogenase maturation nickel metallochaperone HypA [Pirellulales bacterium]
MRYNPASPTTVMGEHEAGKNRRVEAAAMHELSIAQCLVDAACEAAEREDARRVTRLVARIGVLSGVVKEALRFSFDLAAEGTACEGAALEIEDVPVSVLCPRCDAPRELPDCWHFVCPACGTPTPDVVTGRELELVSVEIETHAATHS